MKKRSIAAMSAAVLAALLAPTVLAQTSLRADVPFAFVAGGVEWQPGEYSFRSEFEKGGMVLYISSAGRGRSAIVMAQSPVYRQQGEPAKLVFQCGNGPCRMKQLWDGGSTGWDFAVPNGKREKPLYTAEIRLERAVTRR